MKSTDHNLTNPLHIDTIELLREVPAWENPSIVRCTQDFYDLMETHEPNTIYIISNSSTRRYYLGDMLINDLSYIPKYLVGINADDPNKYDIYYVTECEEWRLDINVICTFDDPIKALEYSRLYTRAGSHTNTILNIFNMIISYIDDKISCNDLILGIIAAFGYKAHPHFQNLTNTINTYMKSFKSDDKKSTRDLPMELRMDLHDWRDKDSNPMFKFYSEVYDVIVLYDFFTDKKYQDIETINLSEELQHITKIFLYMANHPEISI